MSCSTEVNILFCDDDYIRKLNYNYRGKDTPTDVLSFAMCEDNNFGFEGFADFAMGEALMLGDIIISLDTAKRQAKELKHPLYIETYHLLIHGLLHLLGYDHIKENEKKEMFSEHKKIIKEFLENTIDFKYANDFWLMEECFQ